MAAAVRELGADGRARPQHAAADRPARARGRARRRRAGGPAPAQRAPVLRHRVRRARRRAVRPLPRAAHASRAWCSTAAARCPEAAVYAAALSLHQPRVLAAVDRFLTPSVFAADSGGDAGPPARARPGAAHYLPDEAFAERSRAGEGDYALVASRLSPEKGIDAAIDAAARARRSAAGRRRGPGPRPAGGAGRPLRRGRRVPRQGAPEEGARVARRARRRAHALALPRVLALLRAGGDGPGRAGGGHRDGRPAGAAGPRPLRIARATRTASRPAWLRCGPTRSAREREGEALLGRARERHTEARYTSELLALYESL